MTLTADAIAGVLGAYRRQLCDEGFPSEVADVAALDLGRELYRHIDITGISPRRPDVTEAAAARRAARERELSADGGR